jgi:protease IV
MKSFFKYLLASILGVIIASVLLFFIAVGMLSAILASQDKPVEIKSKTVLVLRLNLPINDRKPNMPTLGFNLNLSSDNQLGLNDILNNIEKARLDTNISGIYLEMSSMSTGIATIEEIRNALLNFKKSGKFVIAFGNLYSQGAYYLATAADKVFLNPGGSVDFVGMSAELMFYKKALEKLDIEPEIIRHGKFKSAVEPFMYDKMSPENREQIRTYVGSIWNHIVEQISFSRKIPAARLNQIADSLLLWDDQAAYQLKLTDGSLYKDQVLDTLAQLLHEKSSKDLRFVSYQKYMKVPKKTDKGYTHDKIAIIYAEGDIVMGDQGEGVIGSERLARTIRAARQDSSVKAIVFRVNSGGGSALASEVIWREIDLARRVKPVIGSMGDVAASGGYYILSAADTVVASPSTITGSIGVFGLLVNAKDFLNDKLGITTDVENTNTYSDFGSVTRPLSAAERNIMQKSVDKTYSTFVTHVSKGRKMTYENVDKIGEGRVWSGSNAKEIGLVDTMGGLTQAIEIAAKKANLKKYRIEELPKLEDPFTQIMKELTGDVRERIIKRELADKYSQYTAMKNLLSGDRIQARMPFVIKVQ